MFQSPTKFNISFFCTVLTELTLDSSKGKYNQQSIHISFLPDQGISWISEGILFFHFVFFLLKMRVNLQESNSTGYALPVSSYWNRFTLYMQQARVLLFDMLNNLAWLGPCFSNLVLAILIFSSLPDINTTLTFSCLSVSTWHGLIRRVC